MKQAWNAGKREIRKGGKGIKVQRFKEKKRG